MIRDQGPSNYKLGFGSGNAPYDDQETKGNVSNPGIVSRALSGHPVMRFFTVAAGTMGGMYYAGRMIRKGGMKLGSRVFESDFKPAWQNRLLKDYRDVQASFDQWEGVHRVIEDEGNPLKDHTNYVRGWEWSYEARRTAKLRGEEFDPKQDWTLRDEMRRRMVSQARRLPYELPAAWIAQRAIVDPVMGQRQNQPKWANPLDVVGNFTRASVKNLATLLVPWQAGSGALSHGWMKAMTYGDTAVPSTGFQLAGRHASLSLDAMLRQVGHDASQLLYNMAKFSGKSTGAFAAGINEAIKEAHPLVDWLHKAKRTTFTKDSQERNLGVAAQATGGFLKTRLMKALPFKPLAKGFMEHWNASDYRLLNREAMLRGDKQFTAPEGRFRRPYNVSLGDQTLNIAPGKTYDVNPRYAYFPGAQQSEVEKIAGGIYGIGLKGPGTTAWRRSPFYQGQVRKEYGDILHEALAGDIAAIKLGREAQAGIRHTPEQWIQANQEAYKVAEAFVARSQIPLLPGRELKGSEFGYAREAAQRVQFGEGKMLSSPGAFSDEIFKRIQHIENIPGVPEFNSYGRVLADSLVGSIYKADKIFNAQRGLINERISKQWKTLYRDAFLPAVRKNFDLSSRKLAREAFEDPDEDHLDLLFRRTGLALGVTPNGQPITSSTPLALIKEGIAQRGLDTGDIGQLRAYLTHQKIITKPWQRGGFNALGLRPLTIQGGLDQGFFEQKNRNRISTLLKDIQGIDPVDMRRTSVGTGVWETHGGQILDITPITGGVRKGLNWASTNLQIPILRFNPLQLLGYGANRELAEGSPVRYLAGSTRQPFMGPEAENSDASLWVRSRRAKGSLFSLVDNEVKELSKSVYLYPTDPWSMLGRNVRFGAGEKGRAPRRPGNRFTHFFNIDEDQSSSVIGKYRRFRDRKKDLEYHGTMARRLETGDFSDFEGLEGREKKAEGLNSLDTYLRRFTFSKPLIHNFEEEYPVGTPLGNLFRLIGSDDTQSVNVSGLKYTNDLERTVRDQLRYDKDIAATDEGNRALNRAKSTLWRHLNIAESNSQYWRTSPGYTFEKAGIATRADQFRADVYRYLAMRQEILEKETGNVTSGLDSVTELMNKLTRMRNKSEINQKDFALARAAIANYQISFLSQKWWSLGRSDQERLLGVLGEIRQDSRFKELWADIKKEQLGPDVPARTFRNWTKGRFGLGYSEYKYPGQIYNPFGYQARNPVFAAVRAPGELLAKNPLKFASNVLGATSWADPEYFSGASVPISHGFQRLNRFWSMFGLQIDEQGYSGPLSFYAGGMVAKRILPLYAGAVLLNTADRELGGYTQPRDQNGLRVYSPFVLGHLAAIPAYGEALAAGITGGKQGYEDKKEQVFHGESPIRRGRYWPFGNSPWAGGRIMYYRPSWYRRLQSGYKYTPENWDSPAQQLMYGYDFSPGKLIHPYFYEKKHAYDRPYPETGEAFTGPWGPLTSILNLTVGKIIKPTRLMHMKSLAQGLASYEPAGAYGLTAPSPDRPEGPYVFQQTSGGMHSVHVPVMGATYLGVSDQGGSSLTVLPGATRRKALSPMGAHARGVIGALNQFYAQNSRQPMIGGGSSTMAAQMAQGPTVVPVTQQSQEQATTTAENMILLTQPRMMGPRVVPNAPVMTFTGIPNQVGQYGYEQQELFGIYGFGFGAMRTGLGISNQNFTTPRPVLESASRAYGAERAFWDLNLGGLGDIPSVGQENIEISEIVRRFIPHRRREMNTINPIPNTYINQYPWLPSGGNYFLDFGKGDPFVGGSGGSLMEGEMRLPGPGYERMHQLHPDQYGKYGVLDRYAVLGDIAPYSDEFRAYNKMISRMKLTPDNQAFVSTVKEHVAGMKKRHNWYPYEYAHQDFTKQDVTVTGVVPGQPEMFETKEFPGHPIRLAGTRSTNTPQAQAFMEGILKPGTKVEITWDANQPNFYSSSKEQTIDAIVKAQGRNVNKLLMNSPYAQESRSNQPIDVRAQTGALSFGVHRVLEQLSHRNSVLNAKFLPHRTAVEDWERMNVYGSSFSQWNTPVQSFVSPLLYRSANRNPLFAAMVLGAVGTLFGRGQQAKAALAVVGAGTGFGYSLLTNARTFQTGERFVPAYRQKQNAIDEQADILNYVKYQALYNRYRVAAIKEEGQDPEELAEESTREGRNRRAQNVWDWEQAQVGQRPSLPESTKRYRPIGPLTAEALRYRQQTQRTEYGADPFTNNIMDLSMAIPKRKRDYFTDFLNAPKDERVRILSTAPRLERRIYEARWGMKVEQRPSLTDYFSEHELPPPDWEGWSPNVSMDEVKIKMAENIGLDLSQMGYFPQEVQEANLINPSFPSFGAQTNPRDVQRRLRQLLVSQAIGGTVQAIPSPQPGVQVQYNAGVA